jgi:hypothetical protein
MEFGVKVEIHNIGDAKIVIDPPKNSLVSELLYGNKRESIISICFRKIGLNVFFLSKVIVSFLLSISG